MEAKYELNSTVATRSVKDAIANASFGPLQYVGHSGTYYARYPLGVCQGDCASDGTSPNCTRHYDFQATLLIPCSMANIPADCQDGLYCHQRTRLEPIPFCIGGEALNTTVDFCTWNTSFPEPTPLPQPPIGTFRLKLHREEGYVWPLALDKDWCMITQYDGYPGSG